MTSLLQKLREEEDQRARLFLLAWIASICGTASIVIGGIVLIYIALKNYVS
ncbi:MAG: hypothetical protein SVY15_00195 [Halobacteriota archaeon]|nr:hypothetical protein [Halobacteriota archaeon]